MHTASNTLFSKAINILGAMERNGVLFKVVMPDGTHFGNLPVEVKEKRTRRLKRGTYSTYIDPHLASLKVGDVAQITLPDWMESISDFQSRVCSRAHAFFGSQGYATNTTENVITLMRLK